MSAIPFSCPTCQMNLEAQPEHAGMEVSCPGCQTVMVVPHPAAPEPAAPKGKLSKAPSTVEHSVTSASAASKIVRKNKKPKIGLYIGLGVGAAVIGAGIFFGPQLYDKYQAHKDQPAVASAAPTNAVPQPPPDLEVNEILQKVSALYKTIPSYSVHADSVSTVDMSQINPMLKDPIQTTARLSMLLGRPSLYRVDWERDMMGKTLKGSAWSAGKGDFVQNGGAPIKAKDRQANLMTAAAYSGTLGVFLASTFFDQTNSLQAALKNFSKDKNETLNGRKCYVVAGQLGYQKMRFWIHKDDFLIARAEFLLGGKIDDSLLASATLAQKKQLQMAEKMKGSVVETYSDIETNRTVSEGDFKVAMAMGARNPGVTSQARRLADPATRRLDRAGRQ